MGPWLRAHERGILSALGSLCDDVVQHLRRHLVWKWSEHDAANRFLDTHEMCLDCLSTTVPSHKGVSDPASVRFNSWK